MVKYDNSSSARFLKDEYVDMDEVMNEKKETSFMILTLICAHRKNRVSK